MPIYQDVELRLNRQTAEASIREATRLMNRFGAEMSGNLGNAFSKSLGAFDTSAARAQLLGLENAWRRAADVERDAAARMEVAARRASEATQKYAADSSKAMATQATAARTQRDYADALLANESAHKAHTRAVQDSAAAATVASRAWNVAGVGSLAIFTGTVLEATKSAGDFQQSMIKLRASADELPSNMKTVSDGILNLTGKVGYSATELANGMYTVEKASYRGAEGIKVLTAGAQLASIEQADLTHTMSALTTSLRDFNLGSDQAATVASKLKVAVGDAKTNIDDFSSSLHTVEPVAALAGVSLDQVYASVARITQSGEGAEQTTQNLAQAMRNLMNPTQGMRDAMGKFGLDAHELQTELSDPNIGIVGVMAKVSEAIRSQSKDGQIAIDAFYKNTDASLALKQAYDVLSPSAKGLADQLKSGTLTDFKGLRIAEKNEPALKQWDAMRNKVDGLSQNLRKLQPDIETVQQAFKEVFGGAETLNVAALLAGSPEAIKATMDEVNKLKSTAADAQGNVQGLAETQEGLNAKMRDAKAAFGAAAIEIGNAFIPFMTSAANVAKDVGDTMAKHPAIMHGVVDALGAVAAGWGAIKAMNLVTMLAGITTGLGGMAAAEDAAAVSAGGLKGALSGIAGAAGPVTAAVVGAEELRSSSEHSSNPWFHNAGQALTHNPLSAYGLFNTVMGRAGGGPMHAPGPKGHDSALFWGADGEHIIPHAEVKAAGGHSGIYAVRRNIMNGGLVLGRAPGGPIGSDPGSGGGTVPLVQNPNGTWTSPNPAWAHLIQRESSGVNQRQGIIDSNSGGNEAEGLFQITPATWRSHGGAAFAPNALAASPQQQASIAARILQGDPSGSDWGAGLRGRESASALLNGLGPSTGWTKGQQNDPVYVSMSQNVPGRGPGGQPGYYQQSPQRVSAAEERLRHLDEEIRIAEERKANMKADASQAEKDRLNEELRHLRAERDEAQGKLGQAQQGSFHSGGGRGGGNSSSPFLPVPLADKFGLGKGLPGLAEWAVGFLEDLVLGPMETAAMAAFNGGGMPGGRGVGMPLGPGGFGFGAPGLPAGGAPDAGGPPGDNAISSTGGGSSSSGGSGGSTPTSSATGGGLPWHWGGGGGPSASPGPTPASWLSDPWFSHPPVSAPFGGKPGTTEGGAKVQPNENDVVQNFDRAVGGWFDRTFVPHGGTPYPIWQQRGFGGSTGNTSAPGTRVPGEVTNIAPFSGVGHAKGGLIGYFASGGGPSGTDTVPAWLSPGEEVEQRSAVDKYGASFMGALNQGLIDPSIVNTATWHAATGGMVPQYFDAGTPDQPVGPGQPAPQPQGALNIPGLPKPSGAGAASPPQPGGPGGPTPGGGLDAAGKGVTALSQQQGRSDLATPGAGTQAPGANLPASPGIGFSGGVIGAAEGAASSGASMFAPGSGAAMQVGFQEINRAAAAGAQAAGVGVEGLLESFIPTGSGTGQDYMQTIPGRLLGGIAGVRPAGQNTAGQTQGASPAGPGQGAQSAGVGGMQGPTTAGQTQPTVASPTTAGQTQPPLSGAQGQGPQYFSQGGQVQGGGDNHFHLSGPISVQANNANEFMDSLNQEATMGGSMYAMSGNVSGPGGGR